ncbi:hypothetical protein NMG60_11027092 [Bertholletia excelsa]
MMKIKMLRESQLDYYTPSEFGKPQKIHIHPGNKNHAFKRKSKRVFMKKSNRKKSCGKIEPISLDDFKIFTESMIEELRVGKENMLAWMREELKKLVAIELASRPKMQEHSCLETNGKGKYQSNFELATKTQNGIDGSLVGSVKSAMPTDSNKCSDVVEEQFHHEKTAGSITSNEKEKAERLRLSVMEPICSPAVSNQVVASPYLCLPTVLSEQRAKNLRLDSSYNITQSGVAGSKFSINTDRAKLLNGARTREGYLSCNVSSKIGSENMAFFGQNSNPISTMGNGFPVPLGQGWGNGFNILSQALENSFRDIDNILGLKDGVAIRYSGGELMAFQNQVLKEGHLYPN